MKDATFFVTKRRRNALLKIVKELQDNYEQRLQIYVLDGPQGIGKTYNFLIFSHCLRKIKNVRLVHIQQSENLNNCFVEEILDQFYFTFLEEKDFLVKLKVIDDDNIILIKLKGLLRKYKKKGYILILMVDQINYMKNKVKELLDQLFSLRWDIFFTSQSANNEQNDEKFWKYMYDSFLFSEEEIDTLILHHIDQQKTNNHLDKNFEFSGDNFKRLMQFAGKVPRELLRVIDSEGKTFEEKLLNYANVRENELNTLFLSFWTPKNEYEKNLILKAIYYMDTNLAIDQNPEPSLDRQLMFLESGPAGTLKIFSHFPLCNIVLKKYLNDTVVKKDFFDFRLAELKFQLSKKDLDEGIRGRLYEEFIITKFQNYHKNHEKMTLSYCSQFDLGKKNNQVINFKFFIYF